MAVTAKRAPARRSAGVNCQFDRGSVRYLDQEAGTVSYETVKGRVGLRKLSQEESKS